MANRFLQFHFLTSYTAALLNRDDVGLAKRLPLGGSVRTRISSQCLKRHWRTFEGLQSLAETGIPMSIRSRRTFDVEVIRPLVKDGATEEVAAQIAVALMQEFFQKSAKAASADDADVAGQTSQVTVLGRPEMDHILSLARAIYKELDGATEPKALAAAVKKCIDKKTEKKNLEALARGAGLDAAMFGRFVTSDVLARVDAPIHVAHAFTVHGEAAEPDYFSAIDDLSRESGETGSGHINTTELTSGLFYGYVVIDVPLLVSNLEGCKAADWQGADRTLAGDVASRLVHLISTVSPGAKLGSTAPYGFAHLVLGESGEAQPRSLANAFLKPVLEQPDVLANAYGALGQYVTDVDGMYGVGAERKLAAIGPITQLGSLAEARCGGVPDLAEWVRAEVTG